MIEASLRLHVMTTPAQVFVNKAIQALFEGTDSFSEMVSSATRWPGAGRATNNLEPGSTKAREKGKHGEDNQ